jgi:hypothetical protein
MAKGLNIKKNGGSDTACSNQDRAYMAKLAILALLGDSMSEYERLTTSGQTELAQKVAPAFFAAALKVWPQGGLNLIKSAQFMAEDLGFVIELNPNVKVGHLYAITGGGWHIRPDHWVAICTTFCVPSPERIYMSGFRGYRYFDFDSYRKTNESRIRL